eukprot:TRINITY_DN14138_c0_g1_i1.p1 TRINITY_DN14138_c0_g1~~TRINITY_DN14138_c0_g1_i1.p1  ORF type:complete len:254 (+),score=88.73 TRINITY_DN14138_c0_g1_i1:99-860(+)
MELLTACADMFAGQTRLVLAGAASAAVLFTAFVWLRRRRRADGLVSSRAENGAAVANLSLAAVRSVSFSSDNPSHEALLMRLWDAMRPGVKLPARRCDEWDQIGFQGKDPATDFRGGGILGLLHLVFFAENYPQQARQVVDDAGFTDERAASMRWYLFAVTGINITLKIFNFAGEGKLNKHLAHCAAAPAVTPEQAAGDAARLLTHPAIVASAQLYAHAFESFHKQWQKDRPPVMEMTQYLDKHVKHTEMRRA